MAINHTNLRLKVKTDGSVRLAYNSGKRKIVSNTPDGSLDFGSGTKKAVIPKKKVIAARNLKDWTKFTTQNNEKQKKEKFLTRQFVLP